MVRINPQTRGLVKNEVTSCNDSVTGARELYRAYVMLHEQLVPYVRAAAWTAARTGLPMVRPLRLVDPADPHRWMISDAYGYGSALWVAPVPGVLTIRARRRA